jgi:glycosidase
VKKASLPLIILFFPIVLFSQIPERVEPPNWWTKMHNPNLEILLYGKNIGVLRPKIKSKGIKLLQYKCPENENYLFITLFINSNCQAGEFPIHLYEGKVLKSTIQYSLKERTPESDTRKSYTPGDVIYLITPDRFANGDQTNDNIEGMLEKSNRNSKNGRHGGDIEGIHQHLDYIANLGCTAIWINPLLENNMPKYSYHGYAITDFYKTDPRMGTNESYRALCDYAHQKGLKIIMDGILNHCGLEHWWMKDLPTQDWINYNQQEYTETNHRKTLQPDPHAAKEDLTILENGWFVPTMPDLNLTNPWLATYMIQNSIWWIEYAGIDGIRMDTYLYPDQNFSAIWSKAVMTEYPGFNITGEVWYEQPAVLSYWQKGKTNTNGYVSYLPSLFDFPLQLALVKSLNSDNSWGNGWVNLYETVALDFEYPNPDNLVVFADNHDMSRLYAQLDENIEKVKLALAYILTTRGIPEIYYGTEILMTSPKQRDDGMVRSDFPGGWDSDSVNAFTGAGLNAEQKSMQQYVKKILIWRKTATAILSGKLIHYVPENGIYVYFRIADQQQIMVVLNKNSTAQILNLERFRNLLNQHHVGKEIISGNQISLEKSITISAIQAMIIDCK